MALEGFWNGADFFGGIGIPNLSAAWPDVPRRRDGLTGYHVLYTEPYRQKAPDGRFRLDDFELATARLSALAWRRYNGPVCLVADPDGAAYMKARGMDRVYDEILPVLDTRNYGIDPEKYWASGKIQALRRIETPCVILDLDLVVWRPLDLSGCALAAAHSERLNELFYPPPGYFRMSERYRYPAEWDFTAEALNTSLVYFGDAQFKSYYTGESIRFMQYERDTADDGTRCMVFAEQRILGMCAAAKGISVRTYLDYDNPLAPQDLITHLWSAKSLLRAQIPLRKRWITLCMEKIRKLEEMP